MVLPDSPNQTINKQIGLKLLSIIPLEGRKAREVVKTLATAALSNDSIENKAKQVGISPQTVRNYVEEQDQAIDKMMDEIKKNSLKLLGGRKTVRISIDLTSIRYKGKPVEGISGSKQGNAWDYATATTTVRKKTLILACTPVKKGVTKLQIVQDLVGQVLALGLEIDLIVLDAGFYSVDVLNYLENFDYIMSVPARKVRVKHKYDGEYTAKSKGKEATFRLIVYKGRKGKYLAKATNLDVSKRLVIKWYNKVRTPIETSYKMTKSFLVFTSSKSWVFRFFTFVLAMLIYTLYLILAKGRISKEFFRLLLLLLLLLDNITDLIEYSIQFFSTLLNSFELNSG